MTRADHIFRPPRLCRWRKGVRYARRRFLKALSASAGAAAVASLTGCSWSDVLNAAAPKGGTQRFDNLAYGTDARHRLDYFKPDPAVTANGASRGVIVFFHGGSWRTGSKDDYAFVGYRLAQHGFEAAIVNYRLVPQVRFPAFVEDAARATAWLAENPESPAVGRPDIFIAGHSAGAHIAAMVALDRRFLEPHGLQASNRLAGWIGLSGPYDFLPFSSASVAEVFEEVDPTESQPITFVTAGNPGPPALLATGLDDTTVLPRNSRNLARAISDAGGQATLTGYDGIGHVGTLLAFGPDFASSAPVLTDVVSFASERTGSGPV